jgi:hypothetical protein
MRSQSGAVSPFGWGVFQGRPSTRKPAEFTPAEIQGGIARAAAQPARQRSVLGQTLGQESRRVGQAAENALGNFGRDLRRIHLSQGGGVDEIGMPGDDLHERGLGAVIRILAQKLRIGLHVHSIHSRVLRTTSEKVSRKSKKPGKCPSACLRKVD